MTVKIGEEQVAGLGLVGRVALADPDGGGDRGATLPHPQRGHATLDPVAMLHRAGLHMAQLRELGAGELGGLGPLSGLIAGLVPHLAEQLQGALLDPEVGGELAQVGQVGQQHRMRDRDPLRIKVFGLTIEVDDAQTLGAIGIVSLILSSRLDPISRALAFLAGVLAAGSVATCVIAFVVLHLGSGAAVLGFVFAEAGHNGALEFFALALLAVSPCWVAWIYVRRARHAVAASLFTHGPEEAAKLGILGALSLVGAVLAGEVMFRLLVVPPYHFQRIACFHTTLPAESTSLVQYRLV